MGEEVKLNLQQKLRKIGESAAALQKTKEGYGYKYVPESEVLNVVSAGFNKWGVNCIPSIQGSTVKVERISYQKTKGGKEITVNETLVSGNINYMFFDVDSGESFVVPWMFTANMEDSSQAFGAALTYANRYFFCKFFQIATVEDDPDEYRRKQKENENFEDNKQLEAIKEKITQAGTLALAKGIERSVLSDGFAKLNGGKANPHAITDIKIAEEALSFVNNLIAEIDAKNEKAKTTKKPAEKAAE